jgi:preprotein translocase subunit SecA
MLKTFFQDPSQKVFLKYKPQVDAINALEEKFKLFSDAELKTKTSELKMRLLNGESKAKIIPEAFALVREASSRVLGLRHFDVQLIGGLVLDEGQIAEMKTGEGKTLVALLPTFLNALYGKGTHVITVNDYLARRDANSVGQVHSFLGLTVGLIQEEMESAEKKKKL